MKAKIGWTVALVAVLAGAWLVATVLRMVADQSESRQDRADLREELRAAQADVTEGEAAVHALAEQVEGLGEKPVVKPDADKKKLGERVVIVEGEPGARGPAPTSAQVKAAVAVYCANGRCDGRQPTASQVASAVAAYCTEGRCVGAEGQDGTDGADGQSITGPAGPQGPGPTAEQIATAVSSYCAEGRCKGEPGADGTDGTDGAPGPACPEGYTGQTLTVVTPDGSPGQPVTQTIYACVPA